MEINYNIYLNHLTEKKIIPNFLIDKNENIDEDLNVLLNGLKLVGDYLEKTILKPNNLNQPLSRLQFYKYFKIIILKFYLIYQHNNLL